MLKGWILRIFSSKDMTVSMYMRRNPRVNGFCHKQNCPCWFVRPCLSLYLLAFPATFPLLSTWNKGVRAAMSTQDHSTILASWTLQGLFLNGAEVYNVSSYNFRVLKKGTHAVYEHSVFCHVTMLQLLKPKPTIAC